MADDRTTDTVPMRPHDFGGQQVEATDPDPDPDRGDTIGRFLVLGLLGGGGMGVVYSAYDPNLDRKVALKLLQTEALSKPGNMRTRLLREAQAMARIDHPNVIKVHEVGTHGAGVYIAMEFAEGGTVRSWLKQPRTSAEIVDVYVQAGRGLAAAHAAGLTCNSERASCLLR